MVRFVLFALVTFSLPLLLLLASRGSSGFILDTSSCLLFCAFLMQLFDFLQEPLGGAHNDPYWTSQQIKKAILISMDVSVLTIIPVAAIISFDQHSKIHLLLYRS